MLENRDLAISRGKRHRDAVSFEDVGFRCDNLEMQHEKLLSSRRRTNFIDRAFHVEILFTDVIDLTIEDRLETAHSIFHRHEFAGNTCEGLGDEEWLTE